jgi:hypothetical protein
VGTIEINLELVDKILETAGIPLVDAQRRALVIELRKIRGWLPVWDQWDRLNKIATQRERLFEQEKKLRRILLTDRLCKTVPGAHEVLAALRYMRRQEGLRQKHGGPEIRRLELSAADRLVDRLTGAYGRVIGKPYRSLAGELSRNAGRPGGLTFRFTHAAVELAFDRPMKDWPIDNAMKKALSSTKHGKRRL